jgi:hypothetical protein
MDRGALEGVIGGGGIDVILTCYILRAVYSIKNWVFAVCMRFV